MRVEKEFIKISCERRGCPVFNKCCFLPTEIHPGIDGKVSLLFVGQGGGSDERKEGRPFIGKAGQRLRRVVFEVRRILGEHIGVAFSNTIRDNPEGNRVPSADEIEECLPFLYHDIARLKEKKGLAVVMPLGNSAKDALIPQSPPAMMKARGKIYKIRNDIFGEIVMIPTYHPSYLRRKSIKFTLNPYPDYDKQVIEDIQTAYEFSI